MSNIKKISFNSSDYDLALGIRRKVFILEQNVPVSIEIDAHEASVDHFLLTVDGVPAATGRLRVKDQWIKFERIATLTEFRGRGVGRELMVEMMAYAAKNHPGLTPYLHSQADAVGFYEKLGWVAEGETFYEANIPHLAMTVKPSSRN